MPPPAECCLLPAPCVAPRAISNCLLPSTFLRSLLPLLRLVISARLTGITLPTSVRSDAHTARLIHKTPRWATSAARPGRPAPDRPALLKPFGWHRQPAFIGPAPWAYPLGPPIGSTHRACPLSVLLACHLPRLVPERLRHISISRARHANLSRIPMRGRTAIGLSNGPAPRAHRSSTPLQPIPPTTSQAARIRPGSQDQGDVRSFQFGIKCIDCGGNPRFYRILSSPTRFEAIKRRESS